MGYFFSFVLKNKVLFISILVLATFLRFFHLGSLPPSLNWDEVSHGYTAYSLLETGKDQWGQSWPIFNFRAYGDYPTTANLYLTLPFVKVFGLNAFSIRLPHAILSLIFCIAIYFFTKIVLKRTSIPLMAFFLAAITPWIIFPGRGVFQSNLSQVFLLLGLIFFFKVKPIFFLFMALSMYSYHNTRIIIPILIPSLFLLFRPKFKLNLTFYFLLFIFLLLAIPNFLSLFSPDAQARNRWIGIINPNSINLINENRRLYQGPQFLNLLTNNKVVYFTQHFTVNYLNLFNPIPLFFNGSENYQFNPPKSPLIYLIFLPFFYLGLFTLIKKHRNLFIIFLICLLPAALTVGDFPSIRATLAIPFYLLSITLGFSFLRFKLAKILVILIALISLFSYTKTYLNYNQFYTATWQYGYQQLTNIIRTKYESYDHIYITKKYGEPHQFILFYWPWPPAKFQNDPQLKWDYHSDWYWVNSFDKFVFINDWEIQNIVLPPKSLIATSPNNPPSSKVVLVDTINYPDNTSVFQIYESQN